MKFSLLHIVDSTKETSVNIYPQLSTLLLPKHLHLTVTLQLQLNLKLKLATNLAVVYIFERH